MTLAIPLNRREFGKEAEALACAFLTSHGGAVLMRKFRCRAGDLDIVAQHGKVLAVIEVRQRMHSLIADSVASVSPRKRARIIAATKYLLRIRPEFGRFPVRFDVVALDKTAPQDPSRIEWIQGAFEARV
jgi:putative endonuclease